MAAVCEHRLELASKKHSEKMDDTQKKLDQFYSNIDQVQQQQATEETATTWTTTMGEWEEDAGKEGEADRSTSTGNDWRMRTTPRVEGVEDINPGVDLRHPIPDSGMELDGTKEGIDSSTHEGNFDLEAALEQALSNKTDSGTKGDHPHSLNRSDRGDGVKEQTGPGSELEQGPHPHEETANLETVFDSSMTVSVTADCCLDRFRSLFLQQSLNMEYKEAETDHFSETVNADPMLGTEHRESPSLSSQHRDEVLMLELIERDSPLPPQPAPVAPAKPSSTREYPKDYHTLEFLPYHPLPDKLEAVVFPSRATPLSEHDDPYWPRKKECVDMARDLKGGQGLASYTSTFIAPEARGIRYCCIVGGVFTIGCIYIHM